MQTLPRTYKRTAVDRTTPAASMPPIALERIQTDDNTDTLTRATVQKMCALIRDSATDPIVQAAAAYAKKHFACGSSDAAALAWGVFWYVKHCVKFRSDEGTMMHVGEHALDLLTAPAVLVRMKDPSEDCDGFTMLSAAMLTILGVPVLVTTVAVDLDDPRRWSHVFLCAVINGRVMPLDTSHGKAPGWMVPRSRINRWQTWKLDGSPADVQIPTYHGLHGYFGVGEVSLNRWRMPPPPQRARIPMPPVIFKRGLRGLGQTQYCECADGSYYGDAPATCEDGSSATCTASAPLPPPPATAPPATTTCPAGQIATYGSGQMSCTDPSLILNTPLTPAQAGLTAAQQAQLIAAVGNSAVSLIRTAAGGPYQVAGTNLIYNPATGQLTTASTAGLTSSLSTLTPYLPYLLGGGLLLLLLGRK